MIRFPKISNEDIADGLAWYPVARRQCTRIAEAWGVDFLKVAGIVSALSPSVSWDVNLRDAEALIAHLVHTHAPPTVSTYGNNLMKAIDIFDSDGQRQTIEKILLGVSGFKTHAFFLNLSGLEPNAVTIDRHILSSIKFNEKSLTRKRYYNIERSFQRKAKRMGCRPCDLQAIVWVNYKRVNGI